jgi:DNA modification methylase
MTEHTEITTLPVDSIILSGKNLQVECNSSKGLAKNAAQLMDEPIIVKPNGNKFEVIAGEKGVMAAIAVGLKYVPVIITSIIDSSKYAKCLTEDTYAELTITEKKINGLMRETAKNRSEEIEKLKEILSPIEREHLERLQLKEIRKLVREKKKRYTILKTILEIKTAKFNAPKKLSQTCKNELERVVQEKGLRRNKLNDLTGKEWIKFAKTWFIHNPPPRKSIEMLHPSKFPETLVAEFIEFFTKKGQIVLDPFVGIGSTLVACDMTNRIGIGIEIEEEWVKIAKMRSKQTVILGDVREIDKMNLPLVDFVITSPPYWKQLKNVKMRQKKRNNLGIPTDYSVNPRNLGNIDRYEDFLDVLKEIFDKIYDVVKLGKYLVVVTNNVFFEGKLYPLAFDTAIYLSKYGKWTLKDEKICLQNNKQLLPLGVHNAWVGNRCHEYCLIFRKET